MIRFETTQTIERSAHEVWAYAADVLRHPEWMGVTNARTVAGTGTGVGDRAIERLQLGPRSVDVGFAVSAADPGKRIAWHMEPGSLLSGDVALELEPIGPGRTRAVYSGSIGLKGIWRLAEPFMRAEVRASEAAELARLKANVEATDAIATVT